MITTLVAQCRPAWWAAQCNAVKPRVSRALISEMRNVAFVRTESGDFLWEFHGILIQDFMGVTGKDYNIREIHFTPSFGKKGI